MNANVEFKCNDNGCTPIMEAASSGFAEIISLLHDYGANVNSVSNDG